MKKEVKPYFRMINGKKKRVKAHIKNCLNQYTVNKNKKIKNK